MKKKMVALMTAACLAVISTSVMAEELTAETVLEGVQEVDDFSLHSGNMFGETVEDMKLKETDAGFVPSQEFDSSDNHFVMFEGTFAGISNSHLQYSFHEGDGLYCASYSFNPQNPNRYDNDLHMLDNDFATITDEITKKYGDPIYSQNDGIPIHLNNYMDDSKVTGFAEYTFITTFSEYLDNQQMILGKYNQWLIKVNDYYVLIDHCIKADATPGVTMPRAVHSLNYVYMSEQTTIDEVNAFLDYQKLANQEPETNPKGTADSDL